MDLKCYFFEPKSSSLNALFAFLNLSRLKLCKIRAIQRYFLFFEKAKDLLGSRIDLKMFRVLERLIYKRL